MVVLAHHQGCLRLKTAAYQFLRPDDDSKDTPKPSPTGIATAIAYGKAAMIILSFPTNLIFFEQTIVYRWHRDEPVTYQRAPLNRHGAVEQTQYCLPKSVG